MERALSLDQQGSMRRIALSNDIVLNVAIAGNPSAPPIILLHGFPESHRTWRHQMLALAINHYVIVPDQRGHGESSRPLEVEAYAPSRLMGDVLELADTLGIDSFALAGHDFGGAIAWGMAVRYPSRVRRLIVANAPHPQILQRKILDDPEQRRASQFIRTFRETAVDRDLTEAELCSFFDALFVRHLDAPLPPGERDIYLAQMRRPGAMTAMLNWYRAGRLTVPAMDETPDRPEWVDGPFPLVSQPTLVLWGMRDAGLRPCLLDGLERLVANLSVVRIDAGHFVQWEAPGAVGRDMVNWLNRTPETPYRW